MSEKICLNQIYRHYKGKHYKVLNVVRHSETLEELVLYDCLYENDLGKTWVRPLKMFMGHLEIDGQKIKRFALVEESD